MIDFFNNHEPVFQRDNRALYLYENAIEPFYIEVYLRVQGRLILSAFPIVFFLEYEEGRSGTLVSVSFQFSALSDILKNNPEIYNKAVVYEANATFERYLACKR